VVVTIKQWLWMYLNTVPPGRYVKAIVTLLLAVNGWRRNHD